MRNDVAKFTRTCILCQRTKVFPTRKPGLLQPNEVPSRAWGNISVDLIVALPESEGYTSILVVVDRLTKLAHFIPTHDQLGAPGTARLYKDHVWKHHRLPTKIISDRGTQFASEFMIELNKMFRINTALSTAYHPETDGQTERTNLELEQFLRLFVNFKQNDWADLLAYAEFAYNNQIHSATGFSPFFLTYGYHPSLPTDPPSSSPVEGANEFAKRMANAHTAAKTALENAADDMKRFADKRQNDALAYRIGDKVWLSNKYLAINQPNKEACSQTLWTVKNHSSYLPLCHETRTPSYLEESPCLPCLAPHPSQRRPNHPPNSRSTTAHRSHWRRRIQGRKNRRLSVLRTRENYPIPCQMEGMDRQTQPVAI